MSQEDYMHKPLSDNSKQIRLLQVRPSLAFDEPRCSIEPFYLTDLPPYVALSYRWGNVNDKVDLRIGCTLFSIPFSAWSALQYIELPATTYIWIDAVCIDQSNIPERNAQVVLMSTIYSRASEVYVWLGLGDSQTAIAFNVLSKNLSVLLRPEEIQAVTKLLDNEYWDRTWIIQEIMFAERIILTCGQHRISWDALNTFLTVTVPRHWKSMSGNPYTMSKFDITLAARLVKSRNDFTNQTRSLKVHNNRELCNFLDEHRSSKCSDARDKVFALLGLFNTMAKIPLEVDYFRTKEEVLLVSLAYILDGRDTHRVLPTCSGQTLHKDSCELYADRTYHIPTSIVNARGAWHLRDKTCMPSAIDELKKGVESLVGSVSVSEGIIPELTSYLHTWRSRLCSAVQDCLTSAAYAEEGSDHSGGIRASTHMETQYAPNPFLEERALSESICVAKDNTDSLWVVCPGAKDGDIVCQSTLRFRALHLHFVLRKSETGFKVIGNAIRLSREQPKPDYASYYWVFLDPVNALHCASLTGHELRFLPPFQSKASKRSMSLELSDFEVPEWIQ